VFASTPVSLGGPDVMSPPNFVTAADLDGDGRVEILSANGSWYARGQLAIFSQTTPGAFDPVPRILWSPPAKGTWFLSIAVGDLDRDGNLDLVCANQTDSNYAVFYQTHPGEFATPPLPLGDSSVTHFAESVIVADVDGDGDPDLVTGSQSGVRVFWNSH